MRIATLLALCVCPVASFASGTGVRAASPQGTRTRPQADNRTTIPPPVRARARTDTQWNAIGERLLARGDRQAAESAFVRALQSRQADSLTAALNLARLHWDRGERERALGEFSRFVGIFNARAGALTSRELTAVAIACRYLGEDDPQLFKDALKAFDLAIAADPQNLDAVLALGELFLDKYNGTEAQKTFDAVLEVDSANPRALLGAARRLDFDGQPGADSLLERALRVQPGFVDARVQLARDLLERERVDDARREVDRALGVNPASRDAVAVAAAVRYVGGDLSGYEELRRRALTLNPHDAEFYATMAESAARVRRYAEAAEFARQGIDADGRNWRAHGLYGMNLLRLGRIAEGRTSLETAFAGDPYDVWIKNTLDLLDTFPNYDEITTEHFRFMVEKSESAVLSIYLTELAERAFAAFSERYQYTPPLPVRIEVYRSHADFSVRTVGLPGLGALGVSFGSTLAFDSPAARDAGPFNWGSTVWHELAHTFTLGLTDHRVPRWFSEGLSVYEEHRARPGWGFGLSEEFLDAFRKGKLVPVSRMNDGFMRPAFPGQVQFSYYQASLVCDLIARDWGEPALLRMLREFASGRSTEDVFTRVLGTDLKRFDRRFDDYLRARLAGERPVDVHARRSAADSLVAAGEVAQAIAELRRAVAEDETGFEAHTELARLLEASGDFPGAADALDGAIFINPFDVTVHERLAALYERTGDLAKVVRERRVLVALDPVDRAEALYRLALAQFEAGSPAAARASVLRALEEAPTFAKAQDLLLTIVDGKVP